MILDPDRASLSEEATDWLIRIRENPDDPQVRSGFEEWVLRSPDHRREWQETCRMWQAAGEAGRPRARVAAPKTRRRASRGGIAPRAIGAAVAAGISLCLAALAGPAILLGLQADYQTSTAESRNVTLEDGSTVLLAPDSAISVAFSASGRQVALLEGEAYFDVARDVSRPFVVDGGGLKVEVLGTAFDVRIGGDTTEVALARGIVKASASVAGKVAERALAPGDVVMLDRATGELTRSNIAVADIGAWRDGRLYVVDQTVESVIEQIQRYHPAWISVPDRALAQQKVTGIYDLTAPDQALGALVDPYGGKVRKVSGYLRVVSRF
ncbi:FecR domain-containing protein [Rhizobium puerariae]|uniref:FecR domain-containing protein n=1 Tax=Rhizobium puerariae TaxID=1585791 RepID=A0ABV6AF43_9HYPH